MKQIITDSSLYKLWLENKGTLKDSTIFTYVRSVERFLESDPTLDTVDDYNTFLIKVSVKKRCTHYYSALKSFVEFKISESRVRERIINNMIKPKERHDYIRDRRHLNEDKLLEVINYLESDKHKVVSLIQTATGVRAGDILRLKEGQIIPEEYKGKPVIRLNIVGKGDRRNVVFIFDETLQDLIMDYITTHVGIGDYYFLNLSDHKSRKGNPDVEHLLVRMNYLWFWTDLKQALQTAGVNKDEFATHDFRRCFSRRFWEKYKGDLVGLQSVLNHANPSTTIRYLQRSGLKNVEYHFEMQR